MFGILSWGIVIIVDLFLFFLLSRFSSKYFLRMSKINRSLLSILSAAILSDILVHILITIKSGYSEMAMWASISFPFVGLCLIFINFIATALYEWKNDFRR